MELLQALWAKWVVWRSIGRMTCRQCGEVAVDVPGTYCSLLCEDYAMLENGA